MPQFDFFSFFSQISWLSFALCLFFLIYVKFLLVRSSETLKIRKKLQQNFSIIFFGHDFYSLFFSYNKNIR